MVSALDSGLSGPGSRPSRGTPLLSWAENFKSHSASLHSGV